ncbi:hypothetical protein KO02_09975 [Sphingobacterium sp. ML3W]|nr:hypothetical protein KO02_09975 [Sphingobacterium sp. ML3W]
MVVGGISNEKYIFAIFSKDNNLISRKIYDLDNSWKNKLKFSYVAPAPGYNNIFYLTFSPEELTLSNSVIRDGFVQILNVVDNTIYKIGNYQNSDIHYKSHFLQKSYGVISFLSESKLLVFSQKGELLNTLSSFDAVGGYNEYVVINKDQAVIVSDEDDNLSFKCVTLRKPFGERTIIWSKSHKISDWIRTGEESKNVNLNCYDDEDNVICEYSAIGKKYNSKGEFQDFSETKLIKVNKKTGELIK